MRIAIPHSHPRAEVRQRIRSRSHEIADFLPGFATVQTDWPSEDRMALNVGAMGQAIDGTVEIEDGQVVFTVNLPGALAFVEPMIKAAIKDKGQKLLR